jgi:hypothetical protein
MRVSIGTFDISDDVRRAIRHQEGRKGLATREEVRQNVEMIVEAVWEDYVFDLERDLTTTED